LSSFPWKRIFEYLSEAGQEHDIYVFCYKALVGLEKLVEADGSILQMIDAGKPASPDGGSPVDAGYRERKDGGIFLYDYRGRVFAFLNMHKTSGGGFTDRDVAVMRAVQPHLNNLLVNLTMPSPIEPSAVTAFEADGRRGILSRREAEITGYICRRLSAPQIASLLDISTRTVERHVEHIYAKLGVNRKRDLIRLFFIGPEKPDLRLTG